MAVRKPVRRTRSGVRRHGGQSTVKTVGAVFLCAVLSFGVGFFVLARFWSESPKTDSVSNAASSSGAPDDTSSSKVNASLSSRRDPAANSAPPPAPSGVAPSLGTGSPQSSGSATNQAPGPQIGPAGDDVQSARSVDDGDGAKPAADSEFAGKKGVDDSAHPSASSAPTGNAQTSVPRHRRTSDSPSANSDSVENSAPVTAPPSDPALDQGGVSAASDVQPAASIDSPRPAHTGLYRVQIGVFSTREKAEVEAKRAVDSGFTTHIVTVNSGDRTLYRVQHSAFKKRSNAELDKQKLVAAGFDATIINPTP